jgi:hypothetical protein
MQKSTSTMNDVLDNESIDMKSIEAMVDRMVTSGIDPTRVRMKKEYEYRPERESSYKVMMVCSSGVVRPIR